MSIQSLNIAPDDQKDQIWSWNRQVPSQVDQCPHEWIIQHAKSQPDVLAVSAWDGDLTYDELDTFSTSLAYGLLELGIGFSSFVPICSEKSKWVSVAILGVLKTGAAFLMIDPTHPEPRLQTVIAQTSARTVLCSRTTLPLSSRLVERPTVIEAVLRKTQAPRGQLPPVKSSSPMYVVFTSGSTGVPKGVIISHTAFASGTTYQSQKLKFEPSSRIYDFVNHIFDVFVHYTMTTLATGGCLCIPSETDRSNNFMGSLQETKATHLSVTPSIARLIEPAQVPFLKTLVFLGEPCTIDDTERWWNHVELINAYGPAECTAHSVINNTADIKTATRIGKGAGVNTWIVDPADHNKLVPIGMTGELLLEGALLGLGYLGDSAKTKAAFVQNPSWLLAGSIECTGRSGTLYKTGDLARYTENGELIYVGRKDTQVKVNGQRVELAEVEYWAQRCIPNVKVAVAEVVSPTGKNAARVLAVFYSSDTDTGTNEVCSPDATTLVPISQNTQNMLATHLPRYMVPTVFFCMNELPMTSTGKLNRRRLREIGASFSVAQLSELQNTEKVSKQRPKSELERRIQKVWSEVLATESSKISVNDNFFHLGGDSISAMKVVAEARKIGVNISVTTLFRYPILCEVAEHCNLVADEPTDSVAPFTLMGRRLEVSHLLQEISMQYDLPPTSILDVYPCTPLQEALMSSTLQHPGNNILQNTLELACDISIEKFKAAWKQVYRAMPILRTRFIQRDSFGFLQMVVDEDMQWTDATGLDQYLKADRERSIQLGQPLTRYALVKDDAGKAKWFVWTAHHALYDGQTLILLMNALRRAYEGKSISQGPQFQAYIKYVQEQASARNDDFWQKLLANYQGTTFPISPSSKKAPSYMMKEYQFSRPSQKPLKDITTTVLFRTAWAMVVRHLSGSDDVVFGVTVSGRAAPVAEVHKLVAQTTARIPCRAKLADNLQVSSLLENVQQQATHTIPFEQAGLRQIATLSSDCEQATKFQTLLVVQPSETREANDAFGEWFLGDQAKWFITYPLKIDVQLGGAAPRIFATFDTNILEESKVFQLLQYLESVVYQLELADAATTVAQIDVTLPI